MSLPLNTLPIATPLPAPVSAPPIQPVAPANAQATLEAFAVHPPHVVPPPQSDASKAIAAATPPTNPDLTAIFNRIEQMSNDYAKAQQEFCDKAASKQIVPGDGVFEAESRRLMDMTLGLQQISQSYSMRVELLSKVVEHATGSAKTMLQTQI